MKIISLFSILILLSSAANSQNYELSLDTTDMFTETDIKEVTLRVIDKNSQFSYIRPGITFGINGTKLYLKFNIYGGSFIHIRKEDPLSFKFENKEILDLFPLKTYIESDGGESPGIFLSPMYNINEEILVKFSSQNISQIRLHLNDSYRTIYPTTKNKEKLKSMAKTILKFVKH